MMSPMSRPDPSVLRPGAAGYDEARSAYNLLHDVRPGLIVQPTEAADVVFALELARREGLEVAVKSGGHSLAGHGTTDGGLLVDLAGLDGIDIDVTARTAEVGGGVTAGALTAATYPHGLVVPFGDSPDVGVGGITLGGGIGWLSRKHGLTLDSLLGVEVVLADGRVVNADEREHPDLFWALRGGGGNFGVVTRFRYRLSPLGPVVGGMLVLPASAEVLRGILDLAAAAPDELGTISLVTRLPPMGFVPAEAHGRPGVVMTLAWCGDPDEGESYVDRFRELAPPLVDQVRLRPYPEMYALMPDVPSSVTNITSSFLADDLDDKAIDIVLDAVEHPDDPSEPVLSAVELRVLGGAVARVPAAATAYAHRQRNLLCSVVAAGFEPPRAAHHRAWVSSVADQLSPLARGAYLNFLDAADADRLDEVYPPATRDRLVAVKNAYDPDNFFRRNLNVRPAAGPTT